MAPAVNPFEVEVEFSEVDHGDMEEDDDDAPCMNDDIVGADSGSMKAMPIGDEYSETAFRKRRRIRIFFMVASLVLVGGLVGVFLRNDNNNNNDIDESINNGGVGDTFEDEVVTSHQGDKNDNDGDVVTEHDTAGEGPAGEGPQESDLGRIITFDVANLDEDNAKQTTGSVSIQLRPDWAPLGVKQFTNMSDTGFWKECRFFRVVPGFIIQFGINGDPDVQAPWRENPIRDDPVKTSNARGTVTFATAGPNTRTTQIFINTAKNGFLDKQGFSPIGEVISGMDIVDRIYHGYGEKPDQGKIQKYGNSFLEKYYPLLSYIEDSH
mmetsp:Transcript_12062/g.16868  ORF Transcript_12062/g.16868 Transcript_12062/m.16868 type:complete len:323 (-) Transcript_12062:44-1012(-)